MGYSTMRLSTHACRLRLPLFHPLSSDYEKELQARMENFLSESLQAQRLEESSLKSTRGGGTERGDLP